MQDPAPAAQGTDQTTEGTTEQPASAQRLDAAQAAEVALAQVPGTVVDTWPGTEGGRDVWYVDVRTRDGVVLEVYVDASTGEVLEVEPD